MLGNWTEPPRKLHPAAAAACLALADGDTPIWIGKECPADVQTFLRFHSGAPVTSNKQDATFAVILDGSDLPDLTQFNPGELEYPDRSTTLIIQVDTIDIGAGVQLTGPGINGDMRLTVSGLHSDFWHAMQWNNRRFPLGFDVILATKTEIVSLPRSVQVGV